MLVEAKTLLLEDNKALAELAVSETTEFVEEGSTTREE